MKQPMNRFFKPGLIHFMAYPDAGKGECNVIRDIRKIVMDDFFEAIEITHIENPDIRAEVKEMLKVSGMIVAYGAQPRLLGAKLNINSLDEGERNLALDVLLDSVDEAAEMNAVGMAYLSGHYMEETKGKSMEALHKSNDALCAYAKTKDLNVALEVFDYDMDKCSLIGPAELAAEFAEKACRKNTNFGLMVDLSHLPLLRENPDSALSPVSKFITHGHLGNAVVDPSLPGYGDLHPRFGFPGSANGLSEMKDYLRKLLDIGFLNEENPPILSFEVKPFMDEDPDLVVVNAKRMLIRAWAEI